jgi:hypothetical protein
MTGDRPWETQEAKGGIVRNSTLVIDAMVTVFEVDSAKRSCVGSLIYLLVSYTKDHIDMIPCCHKHALNLGASYTVLEHLSNLRVSV